jgi:glucokinase
MVQHLYNLAPAAVTGVGIGSPGILDPEAGIVHNAVNLGWLNVPLIPYLEAHLKLPIPIYLQRDTFASVLGEYIFGTQGRVRDLVYLSIGSGFGAGAIVNGQLLAGATRGALELGHLTLSFLDNPCACGRFGCVETILSGNGVLSTVLKRLQQSDQPSFLRQFSPLHPKDILQAAHMGDPIAMDVLNLAGRVLGIALALCTAILNPALIVVGGGFGRAALDLLLPTARRELDQRILKEHHQNMLIRVSTLESSALGPAALVWYQQDSERLNKIDQPSMSLK